MYTHTSLGCRLLLLCQAYRDVDRFEHHPSLPCARHCCRLSMVASSTADGCRRQLAALEGEMDGLSCKLNGYERALQDCELQVGPTGFCGTAPAYRTAPAPANCSLKPAQATGTFCQHGRRAGLYKIVCRTIVLACCSWPSVTFKWCCSSPSSETWTAQTICRSTTRRCAGSNCAFRASMHRLATSGGLAAVCWMCPWLFLRACQHSPGVHHVALLSLS